MLTALEGDLSIVEPDLNDGGPYTLSRCIKENVWDVVSQRIKAEVDAVSLKQLIEGRENTLPEKE